MLKTSSIDGTLVPSFAFKDTTSYSGKHHRTGTKVSLVVEESGIPLSKLTDIGSAHDSPLAIPTIQKIPARILKLIGLMLGDKGYDDAKIRNYLKTLEIKSNIPQRELPITWTADGRSLYVYRSGELPAQVYLPGRPVSKPEPDHVPADVPGLHDVVIHSPYSRGSIASGGLPCLASSQSAISSAR